LVNSIVSQKLQKQQSDIWDKISNDVKSIELEKSQIEEERKNLDPMSTDYFGTLKKLDSKAISLNQKINILTWESEIIFWGWGCGEWFFERYQEEFLWRGLIA
jgi:predicted nuclease with TOPRIM domain